jgi:hypothetical protein
MCKISVDKPELFEITDKRGKRFYGGVQYWFPKKGYIPPGACGATTGANIFGYLVRTHEGFADEDNLRTKAGFLAFMKKSYAHLYPRVMGLMADNFVLGAESFAASLGVPMHAERLKVPICRAGRPTATEAAAFIKEALRGDAPVAFLILSSGATPTLDAWHWVTIIALNERSFEVGIIDNGELLHANLSRWLETSIMGGSFVRMGMDSPIKSANDSV